MRADWTWLIALTLSGCAAAGSSPSLPPEVQAAAAHYPPMILGGNVHPTDGHEVPRNCPAAGARVVTQGGAAFDYDGVDPNYPDLCLMRIGGDAVKGWYAIWLTSWGGADNGRKALDTVIHAPSGTVAGFDTVLLPGLQWHDLVRNDGVEDIEILGKAYHALKISHYREGFGSNNYRSVSTIWKDIPTGMLIYGTYQHIAGKPVIDDPLIPTAITGAP